MQALSQAIGVLTNHMVAGDLRLSHWHQAMFG